MAIADQLRRMITGGELQVDDQLPQEMALTKSYNVSRVTIRKALDELVNEGYIYRVQGSGTYVKQTADDSVSLTEKQIELFPLEELTTSDSQITVLKPPVVVEKALRLNPTEFTYMISRFVDEEKQPVAFQEIYLPLRAIQGVSMDPNRASVFSFLVDDLNLDLVSVTRHFKITKPEPEVAQKLGTQGQVLLIDQTVGQRNGLPVMHSRNWVNTAAYDLTMEIRI